MVGKHIRIGIHQPNFVPWLPFFYKMSKCDIFVLLNHVQFEKNGYQNRYKKSTGEWITKPVESGLDFIYKKSYVNLEPPQSLSGSKVGSLVPLNKLWIEAIARTLNIGTLITDDSLFCESRNTEPTERLIDIIKTQLRYRKIDAKPVYITNPDAKNKYLDEDLMQSKGIEVKYCVCPKDMQIHTFEAFDKWGIEGTIKQLEKR